MLICLTGCQAAAASASDTHLMAAADGEDADSAQLNGVVMNGHDDKPFRSVRHFTV